MCLSIMINRPDDVLAKGEHLGFEWTVIHNRMGYRCGYVKVPLSHPWHGKSYGDLYAGAAKSGGRLSQKQLKKIALYLKYIAFILEEGSAA